MSKLMFGYFQNPGFHYIDGNPLYFVNQDRLGNVFYLCQTLMSQEDILCPLDSNLMWMNCCEFNFYE